MAVRIYACSNSCVFLALLSRHRDVFLAVCLFVLPRMMKKKKKIFFILFPLKLRLTTTQPWNRFWQIINFFRASDTFLHPHFFEQPSWRFYLHLDPLDGWNSVERMKIRWKFLLLTFHRRRVWSLSLFLHQDSRKLLLSISPWSYNSCKFLLRSIWVSSLRWWGMLDSGGAKGLGQGAVGKARKQRVAIL